jgi:hypothetical protein
MHKRYRLTHTPLIPFSPAKRQAQEESDDEYVYKDQLEVMVETKEITWSVAADLAEYKYDDYDLASHFREEALEEEKKDHESLLTWLISTKEATPAAAADLAEFKFKDPELAQKLRQSPSLLPPPSAK